MLASVHSSEEPMQVQSRRIRTPRLIRPGLRVAAVMAAIGGCSIASYGQDQFDGEGDSGSDFNDVLNWDLDVYPGDDFLGRSIIFNLPDSDAFNINMNVDVLNLGGLDNTANNADITFEDGGGSFQFAVGALLDTGSGSFTFNIGATFLGDVTFDMYVDEDESGSVTFNEAVVFGDAGAGGTALLEGGSALFTGDVTVGDAYGFDFDVGVQAAFGDVTFEGSHTFTFLDTLDIGTGAAAVFGGDVTFIDTATLTIDGGDADGTATFSGTTDFAGDFTLTMNGDQTVTFNGTSTFIDSEDPVLPTTLTIGGTSAGTVDFGGDATLAGAFKLLVNGDGDQTVNWSAQTEFGGDLEINTTGAGDATVAFSGSRSFQLASGLDEMNITVITDDDDDVSIAGSVFRAGEFNIEVTDGSTLTMGGGTLPGGDELQVSFNLGDGSTLSLGTVDPAGPISASNEWAITALDGSGAVELEDNFDAQAFIRGGDFSGSFTDGVGGGDGKLSVAWTRGESTFTGTADITGAYQARNEATHTVGSEGGARADINGISSLDVIQGTMYLESGDITTATADDDDPDSLFLSSGPIAAATLVLQNDSTLTADGSFGMNTGSVLQVGDTSSLIVTGDSVIDGDFEVSSNASVELNGDLTSGGGSTLSVSGDSTLVVGGAATLAGSLVLTDSAEASFDSVDSAGTITLSDTSSATVIGAFTQGGGVTTLEAGTTLNADSVVLAGGSFVFSDDDLNDGTLATLDVAQGIEVQENATLFGSGSIAMAGGDLEYAGVVRAGVLGATEGLLAIETGNLVSQEGGRLEFGLNGSLVKALSDTVGQSSMIDLTGEADFSKSGTIAIDVQGPDYIPTNLSFTLINAGSFKSADNIALEAPISVTRTWETNVAGSRLSARSDAEYTNTLEVGTSLYDVGLLLDGFIDPANAAPTGAEGEILGQLDTIQTAAAYQAALTGLSNPTAQISAVQVVALSQYHDVLRGEIQRKFTTVERRTPTPFRLGEPIRIAGQDDVAGRAIRREMRADPTSQGFGTYFGRNLTTPTDGDIIGLSGREYGGIGGFGWNLSETWTAGVDLGYSAIMGDLDGGFGNTRVGTLRGGGFATYGSGDGFFADAALSVGWNHFDFNRNTPGATFEAVDSNADGFQVDTSFGLGYRVPLSDGFALTPTGSFLYSYINTGSIDESTNSVIAQSIDPGDLNSFIGRIGADLSWSALPGLVIDGRLGWQGNFTDNGTYDVSLAATGTALPVEVPNQTINTAYYGVGVNWNVLEQIDLNFRWEGRSGEGLSSQMFVGGLTFSF